MSKIREGLLFALCDVFGTDDWTGEAIDLIERLGKNGLVLISRDVAAIAADALSREGHTTTEGAIRDALTNSKS